MTKKFGQITSVVVILFGLGILVVVFVTAYQMLTSPVPGLEHALAQKPSADQQTSGQTNTIGLVSSALATFLLHLAALFIMTIAGSMIAARGIHWYHLSHLHSTTGSASSGNGIDGPA